MKGLYEIILIKVAFILIITTVKAVEGGLVKICVNVACWEKVIGREKLRRAQRISQARGLRPDFKAGASSTMWKMKSACLEIHIAILANREDHL